MTTTHDPGRGGRPRLVLVDRVALGDWVLVFSRDEYADHGRPFGARVGGEFGRQLPQPPRSGQRS